MIDHTQTKHQNKEDRAEFLLAKGCCPVCTIRLASRFHTDCPYLELKEVINTSESLPIDE